MANEGWERGVTKDRQFVNSIAAAAAAQTTKTLIEQCVKATYLRSPQTPCKFAPYDLQLSDCFRFELTQFDL